jgi:carboxymethylenebutenolidase
MRRISKEDIKQEMFDLYDDYAHNKIDRKKFLEKLSLYAVGGISLSSLMSFMLPDYLRKIQVPSDDPRLMRRYPTSRPPCCCTLPGLIKGSMRAGLPMRLR